MSKFLRKIWNDKRGNALVIAGAALPLLVGSAGLATDTIQWAMWKRQLQRAADSAAIAGVYERVQSDATDGVDEVVDHDLELNEHTGIGLVSGYPVVTFPADSGDMRDQVRVTLAVQRPLSFSSMFMASAPMIQTSATAASVPGTDDYCVVSLENTGKTGILGSGNGSVVMDCGMITNSVSANAAAAQGSSRVTATVIAASGGIQQSNNWNVGKYDPFVPAEDDPYADLEVDAAEKSACGTNPQPLEAANGAVTSVDAGGGVRCYSSISVGSNRNMILMNGLFLIDGGSFNVYGNLVVENATIVLTNRSTSDTATIGSFDMHAQGTLTITAPTDDGNKWKGIAIYQDRRAVDNAPTGQISSNSPNKINGGSASAIQGVLYFPKQQLTYNGGGNVNSWCTQFVVKRIVFGGNNNTNITAATATCAAAGVDPINGGRRVRLVA